MEVICQLHAPVAVVWKTPSLLGGPQKSSERLGEEEEMYP